MKRIEIHTKHEFMRPILDALTKVGVGGLTVTQVRGRGKNTISSSKRVKRISKICSRF
jgi:nitrogen regulatory protein PII